MSAPQFVRVGETGRKPVTLFVDGAPVRALEGDTVLSALLLGGHWVRQSEFDDGPRAGFCLMAACQDCWTETETGERLRACSTYVRDGLRLRRMPRP